MYEIGYIFKNKKDITFEIVAKVYRPKSLKSEARWLYKVRSTYGYEKVVDMGQIQKGDIKDRYAPTVHSIGAIGDVSMMQNKKEYALWYNMLTRCYCQESKYYKWYGSKGITVENSWLKFSNFLKDIPTLEGYNKEELYLGKLQLDKDFKQKEINKENQVYSKETCIFCTQIFNYSLEIIEHVNLGKKYIVTSPEGKSFEVLNLRDFCDSIGLNIKSARAVVSGVTKSLKGWNFKKV